MLAPGGASAVFAIRDLSAGGARLVGQLRLAEQDRVEVLLQLEGHPLAIAAEVVRVDPQRAEVVVRFRAMHQLALDIIEKHVGAMIDRVRAASPPTVLVVHSVPDTSAALERDLARLGTATRVAATTLELIWHLQDRQVSYRAVIVAGDLDGDVRTDVLRHLEAHHPQLRCVLLFGARLDRVDHASAGRVHAVLRTPWRLRGLARALDLANEGVERTFDMLSALSPEDASAEDPASE